jgi:hypothetical protein
MGKLLNQAQEIADYIANKTDAIDLIYLYGGVAQGREHKRSDIEMTAVSDDKLIRWEFILDNRPIFIWPSDWKQLENIAAGRIGNWSVSAASIAHAKILWSKSDEMVQKFKHIQKQTKIGAKLALKRAITSFDGLYGKLWRIQKAIETGGKIDTTFLLWDLINELINILAALNERFLLNNWGKQLQEIRTFQNMPKNFETRYNTLIIAKPEDALKIASELVDDVNVLLKNWILENQANFKEDLEEITTDWPTVLEFLNKAITATEQNDISAGLYAASDNARFNLWAFTALRQIKWAKNSFFIVSEEIKKLPRELQDYLLILLESTDLLEIQNATEQLSELLKKELKDDRKLPVSSSIEEALQFLQVY